MIIGTLLTPSDWFSKDRRQTAREKVEYHIVWHCEGPHLEHRRDHHAFPLLLVGREKSALASWRSGTSVHALISLPCTLVEMMDVVMRCEGTEHRPRHGVLSVGGQEPTSAKNSCGPAAQQGHVQVLEGEFAEQPGPPHLEAREGNPRTPHCIGPTKRTRLSRPCQSFG